MTLILRLLFMILRILMMTHKMNQDLLLATTLMKKETILENSHRL
jgi:hypothetical protein